MTGKHATGKQATGNHATGTHAALTRRTLVAAGTTGALAGLCAPLIRAARAAPTVIRYATGGGIGPNEMETVIYLDWMQKNVLKYPAEDFRGRWGRGDERGSTDGP